MLGRCIEHAIVLIHSYHSYRPLNLMRFNYKLIEPGYSRYNTGIWSINYKIINVKERRKGIVVHSFDLISIQSDRRETSRKSLERRSFKNTYLLTRKCLSNVSTIENDRY